MKFKYLLIALISPLVIQAQEPAWITDPGKLMTDQQIAILDGSLNRLYNEDSVELTFIVLPSLPADTTIEDYARQFGRDNHIGDHNGIVFVITLKEHLMRMEVADQLESIFPDITCRTITETAKGFFHHGDYFAGMEAVLHEVDTDVKAAGGFHSFHKSVDNLNDIWLTMLTLLGMISIVALGTWYIRKKKRDEQRKPDERSERIWKEIEARINSDAKTLTAPPPQGPPPSSHHYEEHPHGYREEHPHKDEDRAYVPIPVPDSSPSPSYDSGPSLDPGPSSSPDFGNSGFDGGGATNSF